ncbi:MAG: chorismate mutase [Clostridiales bacterium]|nr:chorismate mutase [Clostridiales bacterium]
MGAIRGAICAENTVEDISAKSLQLVSEIISRNKIDKHRISAIFFSCTDDLNACYPAKSVREQLELGHVAFMCFAEMSLPASLKHCIRACVFVDGLNQEQCIHCYLGEASVLRTDLK